MINKIVDAICNAIYSEFGDKYKIYTDQLEQGTIIPCFFVFPATLNNRLYRGKRYLEQNLFTVLYFPSTSEITSEINTVIERLFKCLEYIDESGDLLRGTNMNAETVDGILHFAVNYDLFTISKDEMQSMEGLKNSATAKG